MPRKATKITFVLDRDYTKDQEDLEGIDRYAALMAMNKAMKLHRLDTYELITCDDEFVDEKRIEMGIPEIWTHNADTDDLSEHYGYYVAEFDDKSTIIFCLVPTDYPEEETTHQEATHPPRKYDSMFQ